MKTLKLNSIINLPPNDKGVSVGWSKQSLDNFQTFLDNFFAPLKDIFKLDVSLTHANLKDIPFVPYDNYVHFTGESPNIKPAGIDPKWINDFCFFYEGKCDVLHFQLPKSQWPMNDPMRGWCLPATPDSKGIVTIQTGCDENDQLYNYNPATGRNDLVDTWTSYQYLFLHEILHALPAFYGYQDNVHAYIFNPANINAPLIHNLTKCLDDFRAWYVPQELGRIQIALNVIRDTIKTLWNLIFHTDPPAN